MNYDYRLIIIGSGSAGLAAAELCSELKLSKVLLVEKSDALGGECLHSGCVPSKALLYAAQNKLSDPWNHVRESIKTIQTRSDNDAHYEKNGVDVIHGSAKFLNKNTIQFVNGTKVTSKYFLVATGSKPTVPDGIKGLETTKNYTNETIFNFSETPGSLVIIGGGPIGCEMATAFGLLGTNVTLLQRSDRLLPREEKESSEIVTKSLESIGVTVLLNAKEYSFDKDTLLYKDQHYPADHVLVAAGRTPIVPEGISATDKGIVVNKYMQTSHKNIYAAGDCTTGLKFTHLAGHQASLAVKNMLSPFKSPSDKLQTIPWITFTQPEIARIGTNEVGSYTKLTMPLSDIDRAITDNNTNGYISVIVDSDAKIKGATVVGHNASEILAPLSLLFYQNRPITDLNQTVLAYPTLSNALNTLALRYTSKTTRNKWYWSFIAKNWR